MKAAARERTMDLGMACLRLKGNPLALEGIYGSQPNKVGLAMRPHYQSGSCKHCASEYHSEQHAA
jgi:hypothetical protein